MSDIYWNLLKNERLKKTRGATFDEVLGGKIIAIKKHPKKEHQKMMLIKFRNYIWVVPYIFDDKGNLFLKTLFPSRKYTRLYKEGQL